MAILPRMSRVFRYTFLFLALLVVLLAVASGVVVWKLTDAPLASTELTHYVEAVFARLVPGTQAEIKHSSLTWDNDRQIVALRCEDARLYAGSREMVAYFPSANLRLSVWSLLRGRILPLELGADNAQFWLKRGKNGSFFLGEAKPDSASSDDGLDVFSVLTDIGDEIAGAHLRHLISINEAKINVHEEGLAQNWTVTAREISLDHQKKSAVGTAKIEVAQKDKTSSINLRYHFDFKTLFHHASLDFKDIKLSALAPQLPSLAPLAALDIPLTGTFSFGTDRDLNLSAAKLKVDGAPGQLVNKEFWDKPRNVQSLALEAVYDEIKNRAELTFFQIDFGGPKLEITGEARTPADSSVLWMTTKKQESYTVTIKLKDLPMDQFASVWPKQIIPDARLWIVENLTKGVFKQGEVTVKGKLKWDDLANSTLESGGGAVSAQGGRVTYLAGMPAVDDVDAEATFDLTKMDVSILKGNTGPIKIKPFTLRMTDFERPTQYITIPLELVGPVPDVLRLLDSPPLGYAKAVGLDANESSGQVEGILTLHMPMLDALLLKDVDIEAKARFKNFGIRKLIPHIEIAQSDLNFDLSKGGFALKGGVGFNGVQMNLDWKSRFSQDPKGKEPLHQAFVSGALKGTDLAAFGVGNALEMKGSAPVTIRYENLRKGFSKLDGSVDLQKVEARVPDLNWTKPKNSSAKLSVAMEIQDDKDVTIKTIDLQGKGIKVKGSANLDAQTGELRQLTLDPLIVGRSNASVWMTNPTETDHPQTIRIEGESLDISGKTERTSEPQSVEARPKDYRIKLTKLYTGENGYMSSVAGRALRDKIGWAELDFFALAQGVTPVTIKLLPEKGNLRFSFVSDNFGNALTGLGFTEAVKGGDIQIEGESSPEEPRSLRGKIKTSSFVVKDLPVLARLLSAVSPFGFLDLITGEAGFDHLRGEFKWSGDQIDLSKVRAAGSVVGINLDGRIDMKANTVNLNGTLVPFSFMNSIIGSIPLLGDVITGGEGGGVIAAAFTIHGTMGQPDVSVNPVSLLTPGFLRTLFFQGDDEEPSKPEAKTPAPK